MGKPRRAREVAPRTLTVRHELGPGVVALFDRWLGAMVRAGELRSFRLSGGVERGTLPTMASEDSAAPAAIVSFSDAVDQWVMKLTADHRSRDTLSRYPRLIRQMAMACGWSAVQEAKPDRIIGWLSGVAVEEEWSGKSHNNALSALNSFFGFCLAAGWIDKSPAAGVGRATEEAEEGMRPFTMAEQEAILAAAPARHTIYQFARETGLRKGNQFQNANHKSVLCGMVRVDAREIRLPAKFLKNRKPIVIPITDDLAERLRPLVAGKPADEPVFPEWCDNRTLFDDMERAGVPRVNEHGEPAAWHSWRKGFLSALAEAGVHPKTAQELAGHSTIMLTMKHYTRVSEGTKRAAVEKIFPPAKPHGTRDNTGRTEKRFTTERLGVAAHGGDGTISESSEDRTMSESCTSHDATRASCPAALARPQKHVGSAPGVGSPRHAVRDAEKPPGPFDPRGYTTPWEASSAGIPAPSQDCDHGGSPRSSQHNQEVGDADDQGTHSGSIGGSPSEPHGSPRDLRGGVGGLQGGGDRGPGGEPVRRPRQPAHPAKPGAGGTDGPDQGIRPGHQDAGNVGGLRDRTEPERVRLLRDGRLGVEGPVHGVEHEVHNSPVTERGPRGTDAPADPYLAFLIREQEQSASMIEQSQTRLSLIKWLITLRDAAKDHPLIVALIVGAAIVVAGASSWCVKAYLAADDTGARQAGDRGPFP